MVLWREKKSEDYLPQRRKERQGRRKQLFNLRTDPYERADTTSNTYYNWFLYHAYMLYGSWAVMDKWAATFKEFPPVQKPNSFTIDEALHMLTESAGGGKQ